MLPGNRGGPKNGKATKSIPERTKAAKALEAQRRDFMRRCWWLDSTHANAKCPAALAWETLRRTKFYPALWRKAVRERAAFLGKNGTPDPEKEKFRLMHLATQARVAVGQLCWGYLMNGFDPEKTWLELAEWQRLTAQGHLIDGTEAVKANNAWTRPRQDYSEPPLGAVSVGFCDLAKDSKGKVSVSKPSRGSEPLAIITETKLFQRLNPGRYLICCFDIRQSREGLLQAWTSEMTRWLGPPWEDGNYVLARQPTEHWTPDLTNRQRPMPGEVRLLPSNDPAFVILLLPATYNRDMFRSVFQGKLKKEQRDKWLPACAKFWKTLTVTIERFPRNPDGTKRIECDPSGQVIREKVVKHRFDPKVHLPPKQKRGKSGARRNLWLGLAACDVVSAKEPLGKSSPSACVLRESCESYAALFNHRQTAKSYLNELDESFGRLDQNLAHRLRENRRQF